MIHRASPFTLFLALAGALLAAGPTSAADPIRIGYMGFPKLLSCGGSDSHAAKLMPLSTSEMTSSDIDSYPGRLSPRQSNGDAKSDCLRASPARSGLEGAAARGT